MDLPFTMKLLAWTLAVAFVAFHLGRFWEIDKRLRRVLLLVVREVREDSAEYTVKNRADGFRAGEGLH